MLHPYPFVPSLRQHHLAVTFLLRQRSEFGTPARGPQGRMTEFFTQLLSKAAKWGQKHRTEIHFPASIFLTPCFTLILLLPSLRQRHELDAMPSHVHPLHGTQRAVPKQSAKLPLIRIGGL